MRIPSRLMPEYVPAKGSPFAIAFLLLLFIALTYFYPKTLIIITGIFVLIIAWEYFEKPKIDEHFEKMRNDRKELSICDFAREFDCKKIDTWIVRAIYEQLQTYISYNDLIAIKGSDKLEEDLHIDDEDLDLDLVEEISQRTGRTLDNYEANPYYGKIKTVRDLVLFFNHQPKS